MKKVLKVILIILGAFMFALMIVKCAGQKTVVPSHNLPLNNQIYKPVNNVKVSDDYYFAIPSDSVSVPSNLLNGVYNVVLTTFSDGSSIVLNYESPYVFMDLKYRLPDSSTLNTLHIARYYYSNYHYYNSITQKEYVVYYNITSTSYDLTFGSITLSNASFIKTTFSDIPSGANANYLTEVNQDYNSGYGSGYYDGQQEIFDDPSQFGYITSSQYDSLKQAYDQLYAQADQDFTQSAFKNLLNQVIGTPYNAFKGMFNFEFFGVNLFDLFSFLFTCALVGFLLKKII